LIIVRAPFRISFFGGGTDYPIWYEKHGGEVLGTSIDKYSYISCRYLPPFFEHKYRVVYSTIELTNQINEIDHPSVRECLRFLEFDEGVEVHYDGDLPARSGMGSSSSFTVALLRALFALKKIDINKQDLALKAIHVEQNLIGESVGSQDQTLASFGGLNHVKFSADKTIDVSPLPIPLEKQKDLQSHLMLVFTGLSRIASEVASEQIRLTPDREKELSMIQNFVTEGIRILKSESDLSEFGLLLGEAWKVKRSLTNKVSNKEIDEIYEAGLSAGAVGGKLLGAGGGGFVLLFAKPEFHEKIIERLKGLLVVPVHFDYEGSKVLFSDDS